MKQLIDFPYKSALVLGLAKSGTAAADLLLNQSVKVRVNDMKTEETDPIVTDLKRRGAEVVLGSHPLSVLDGIDLLIKNPGIPYDHIIVAEAEKRGLPIITEIELASELAEGPIIGITGSNGKTTTTTLVREMLAASNVPVKAAGNIGKVAAETVQSMGKDERLVLELSSFQLQGTIKFHPNVAVFLNLFEAHLDYHKTIDNYLEAKSKIFANQSEDDFLIYNADDEKVSKAAQSAKSQKIPFSLKQHLENGAWADDNAVYFRGEEIIKRAEIALVGEHNLSNILAAISASKLSGATTEGIRSVLKTFSGVKHRLQFVTELQGRYFYNDSKATNILATEKALSSFTKPVILLCGGLDRGNSFEELEPSLSGVKAMVVFGETAAKLTQSGKAANIDQVVHTDNMQEAVEAAWKLSEQGDVILLSPACASWDQYPTFEKRGDMFIEAVHTLI
ncbi:UDP-N-acetylmuramoyl-L-alanine--D-glutamate ligase [Aciduricibacillus chroicocephali]|uniref:UDP-N-acetylmuramoylalanine--D-glutamate ligase n=1 Tax=Aciduricibacillus chroicocephali TaxID=3054939 RepID=A0ABY9L1K7_9BACI|nr:UDP-N-acetylmuramoyl-L-alanine--D-glutamate ligase [Bacillaceae bacterium 44XB]